MKMHLKKAVIGSLVSVMCSSGIAAASGPAVGVDVVTPNVRVQVGNPAPPPSIAVVEREHVIVRVGENGRRRDESALVNTVLQGMHARDAQSPAPGFRPEPGKP